MIDNQLTVKKDVTTKLNFFELVSYTRLCCTTLIKLLFFKYNTRRNLN